ncbi:MAG: hypothetical protein R2793_00405 [Flavobacteriaceae bacterium]
MEYKKSTSKHSVRSAAINKSIPKDSEASNLEDNRLQSQSSVLQRVIKEYKTGTLRSNYKIMKGLTQGQAVKIQQLHNDPINNYTVNEARHLVGAAPLPETSKGESIPFPWRYSGATDYMGPVHSSPGGYVAYPSVGFGKEQYGTDHQGSFVVGSDFSELQKGSKRNITQSSVMKISPNVAAKALKLGGDAWEWLHLVAFSIKETHISSFSAQSMKLFERTGQPQQISENLVLGSAGANTAMLTYETLIKNIMRQNPTWTLNLAVQADIKKPIVDGVVVPVAQHIAFDFQFVTDSGKMTAPVVLRFNPLSSSAPSKSEYTRVVEELKKFVMEQQFVKPTGMKGISTRGFHSFGDEDSGGPEPMDTGD